MRHLYQECTRQESFRLRNWAVATLAWTLSNEGGDPLACDELFSGFSGLRGDYVKHMDRTADSKVDVRAKNPQPRLPRNKLKNEERHFGFRQCSFHSHRSRISFSRPGIGAKAYSGQWFRGHITISFIDRSGGFAIQATFTG